MQKLRTRDFNLSDSMECGQTFCWQKHGEGYVNADVGQCVYVQQKGDTLFFDSSSQLNETSLTEMLRLSDPLDQIQGEVCKDELMRRAIQYAPGLRVVKDPEFPCLISFLCSIRNNIPNIRKTCQEIRRRYGPVYRLMDTEFHGMPGPERLAGIPPDELRELGLDWRAEFIARTSMSIVREEVMLSGLCQIPYEEAHTELKRLYGVGDKVADCVCLFALGHLEAFPIDVWIERVIQKHYGIFTQSGKSYAKKSEAARAYFGRYAGYAQEYLYYYSRNTF
ncbi:MAG: hypothetical protein HXY34_02850 [Candidatus Thorarchaeota archaeon]|nr:hypothetical protein [Candidatus Thorarchaeota archaeon]